VLTLTSDPDLRIAARLDIGWSLLWSGRNADALETLIAVAAEASARSPTLAWDATGLAATGRLPDRAARSLRQGTCRPGRSRRPGEPVPSAKDRPAGWADERRIWITDQLTLQQRHGCGQARRS